MTAEAGLLRIFKSLNAAHIRKPRHFELRSPRL
jgi:hypothetical protein